MIHLDTSFLIRALIRGSAEDQRLRSWLVAREALGMSAIAWTEFLCGPVEATLLSLVTELVTERVPFSEDESAVAAALFNASGRRRGSLIDCMIAAAAIRAGAPLATANSGDFRRFRAAGLRLASV